MSRRGSCCRTYGRRVLLSKMGKYGRRASSNRIIVEGDRAVGREGQQIDDQGLCRGR